MIIAEKISRNFGAVAAVNNISFEVKEGETLVLLGRSGCGKTTTLRMINRLTEPTSGTIWIDGKSIFSQPAEILRRSMGYVLQSNGLFPHYTVAENIAVVPRLLHWNSRQIEQRITALLQKLQLSPGQYLNAYPDQLSGGQQQRVGLARALAADPPILLMDEPFGALDPITRAGIRREFSELDELKRKTILLVTHDVQEAFELADRICLMEGGTIMQIGKPAELLFKPANDFVRSFFNQQRLFLELKAVKLHHIWNSLEDTNEGGNSNPISWNQSLWDAIESLSGQKEGSGSIIAVNEQTNERKKIHFSSLLTALNQFKSI